jgi:hypothetical protein
MFGVAEDSPASMLEVLAALLSIGLRSALNTTTQQKVGSLFPFGLAEAPAAILVDFVVVCMVLSLPRSMLPNARQCALLK